MDSKKELERLVADLMEEDRMQQPSTDFTQRVVEIAMQKEAVHHVYKPLLPQWIWYAIALLVLCLIIIGLDAYTPNGANFDIDKWLEPLQGWSLNFFPEMHFSKTALYVSVVGGFLACLQMVFLKNYLNSRWT